MAAAAYWLPRPLISLGETLYPDIIWKLPHSDEKQVLLSIDDLPSAKTATLLATLARHNVRALLFVISGWVNDSNRHLLVQAVQQGHVLGNHGATDFMAAQLSFPAFTKELIDCDHLIDSIYKEAGVDRPCKLYRPGCGFFSSGMLTILEIYDYQLVLGTVYPHDPLIRSAVLNDFFVRHKLQAGDIIILHDRPWTFPLLDKLLPWIKENGYNFWVPF